MLLEGNFELPGRILQRFACVAHQLLHLLAVFGAPHRAEVDHFELGDVRVGRPQLYLELHLAGGGVLEADARLELFFVHLLRDLHE